MDIDRQSSTPLYVQLKELIAAEIRDREICIRVAGPFSPSDRAVAGAP